MAVVGTIPGSGLNTDRDGSEDAGLRLSEELTDKGFLVT